MTAPNAVRFRLGRTLRRAVLVAYIVAAGAWIGIDVLLGVLSITALTTGNAATEAIAYHALGLFVIWPVLTVGLLTLVTGITLGLGTNFGLVRYCWFSVELTTNLILVTLIAFVLRPGLIAAGADGEAPAAGTRSDLEANGLLFPPIVSLAALLIATSLSVYRPWGRIRKHDDHASNER